MSQDQPRPRLLLADDHAGVVSALKRLLAPICELVGHVSDGGELLDAVTRLRPDVVVLDLNLPRINGLDACRRIKQAAPTTKVILLTAADDTMVKERALKLGASAFVLKIQMATDLIPAIERAVER
jgi:DNA-binding NarL/FixJ family response regulator